MSTPRPPSDASKAAVPIALVAVIGCVVAVPVLVAVIGIVAAIAIPNFIRFECKSKQSEAKVNLTGLFVSEKAFFGEYNFYTTDLKALNWQPDGSPAYLYGFVEAGPDEDDLPSGTIPPSDYDPSRKDTSDPTLFSGYYTTAKMRDVTGNALTSNDFPDDAVVAADGSSFRAAAIGDLSPDGYGSVRLDVWTIDESKNLRNAENDCN